MRKILPIRFFHYDVLVFDIIGENWIHHCLPDGYTVKRLDIRDHIPILLDIRFLFMFIKRSFLARRTGRYNRSYAWLSALFDRIAPKIILTCADNNPLISRYAEARTDVNIIFLQNALRSAHFSSFRSSQLPHYLSLGELEQPMFESIGVTCRHYRPTGSVKLGLALQRAGNADFPHFDLCFISHYRTELFAHDSSFLFQNIEKIQRILFQRLCEYASSRRLSLAILCKSRDTITQAAESHYFSTIAPSARFEFIRSDKADHEFDSYLTGLASDFIVHPASTLGFELFAAGKKVLFGASANSNLIKQWGIKFYFDALPDLVRLKDDTSKGFFKQCDHIRGMTDFEFSNSSRTAATRIVSMPHNEYPHENINRFISGLLSK